MPIALFSDPNTFLQQAPGWMGGEELSVLLSVQGTDFSAQVAQALPDLQIVDIAGPRMRRLNFDAIGLTVVDLPLQFLLGPAGRRLVDVLGHMAQEHLTLGLVGAATAAAGAFLLDGVTAGLNLIPHAVVVPDVQQVPDLRALLEQVSRSRLRLLALDGLVTALYFRAEDQVSVTGKGNVLLAAFHVAGETAQAKARLHVLSDGMQDSWP